MRNKGVWLLAHILPSDVIWVIDSYIPRPPKKKESPSLQRELTKIQKIHIRNLPAMYMRDLEDFLLG